MNASLLRVVEWIGIAAAGAGGLTILAAFARKRSSWVRPGTTLLFIGLIFGIAASVAGR